jgi:hypothetical protein
LDANNPELLQFVQENNYHINKDKTKFGRIKQILQAIVSGLGAFALLVILLAMMLFSFYLQLMIARSKDNLQLLLTLGYSPDWLSKTVAKKWIPVYGFIVLGALLVIALLQVAFRQGLLNGREELSLFIHPAVILIAVALFILCILINFRLIRKFALQTELNAFENNCCSLPYSYAHGGKPVFAFLLFISWRSVVEILIPLQPSGWPIAIEPPLTLLFPGRGQGRECMQCSAMRMPHSIQPDPDLQPAILLLLRLFGLPVQDRCPLRPDQLQQLPCF